MAWEFIDVERDDGVATVTLNRPARRNAMHGPMWKELREIGESLTRQPPRAVILTGAGEHFCAGMDLRPDNPLSMKLAPAIATQDRDACRAIIEGLKASVAAITHIPCPVVAAIEGACFGGGLELALCADLRVVGESTRFSMPETRWGLVPDVGGTVRLTRAVGATRAADLILTGREARAAEALSWGLVNRVVPDGTTRQAALALVQAIRRGAPIATREAVLTLRQVPGLDEDAALARETEGGVTALVGQEALEGLAAFGARRDPRWTT